MEKRARSSPYYDPRTPWKIKTGWRTSNEAVSAGEMVRSDFQQVEMGVRPITTSSGRRAMLPGSTTGKRAATSPPNLTFRSMPSFPRFTNATAHRNGPVQIPSPDPKYYLFAHRLHGPEGRVTLIYAYPKTNTLVLEDELVGNAIPNLLPGEPYLTDKANKTVMEPFDKVLFQVTIPGLRREPSKWISLPANKRASPRDKKSVSLKCPSMLSNQTAEALGPMRKQRRNSARQWFLSISRGKHCEIAI